MRVWDKLLGFAFTAFAMLCLLSAPSADALPRGWSINQCRTDTWGVRDGLPAYQINGIGQTPDGFIWLATMGGLVRFDGSTFERYTGTTVPALASDKITALAVDGHGRLNIGDVWGGYGVFDNGRFQRFGPDTTLYNETLAMLTARDGTLWVSVRSSAPFLYHVTPTGTTRYQAPDAVVGIAESPTRDIVCAVEMTGLFHVHGNKLEKLPYNPPVPLSSVAFTSGGTLWCGTRTHGLCRIAGGHLTKYTTHNGLPSDDINTLLADREGGFWIGTTAGLVSWDGNGFTEPRRLGAVDADVTSIFEDRESNLWVGTAAGLCRASATRLIPNSMTRGTAISTMGQTSSIAAAAGGGIWCATDTGLWRVDEHSTRHYSIPDPALASMETITEAADGTLWGWTRASNGAILLFHVKPQQDGTAKVLWKQVLSSDLAAQNLIGGRDGVTIFGDDWHYDDAGYVITVSNKGEIRQHRTKTGYTFAVSKDGSGGFWIGSDEGFFHYVDGVCTPIDLGLPPGDHVASVDVANDGTLWLAGHTGIVRYQHGQAKAYPAGSALPKGDAYQILTDGNGRVWVGTDSGIYSARKTDFDAFDTGSTRFVPVVEYGAADGVQSYPVTFCDVRDSLGRLWFGSDKGVTCIDTDRMFTNRVEPPVRVETATVDGVPLSTTSVTRVVPGAAEFSVRAAALTYTALERVRYRHILEGFDRGWRDSDTGEAKYTNLPPGRYTFRVVACNSDGVWNNAGASITFEILPHYYQTGWFLALCLVMGVVVLLALYQLRTRAIIRRSRALEAMVAERTAELIASNDELQEMQAELEARNDELLETREVLAAANARLEDLATTDGLTRIKNHRAFREQLEAEWRRYERGSWELSLILVDVDRFKQYNDSFGHPAGDQVLKIVAQMLQDHARETDFVARYGGEEFVIVLPETDADGAMNLAERLRAAIEAEEWPMRAITASFGVATVQAGIIMTSTDLIAAADDALYRSKQDGRNRSTHFTAIPRRSAA